MFIEMIQDGEPILAWLPLLKALYCWVINADTKGWVSFVAPWRVSWDIHKIVIQEILCGKRGLLW